MVTSTHESHVKIWLLLTCYLLVLIDNELGQTIVTHLIPYLLLTSNESEQNMIDSKLYTVMWACYTISS